MGTLGRITLIGKHGSVQVKLWRPYRDNIGYKPVIRASATLREGAGERRVFIEVLCSMPLIDGLDPQTGEGYDRLVKTVGVKCLEAHLNGQFRGQRKEGVTILDLGEFSELHDLEERTLEGLIRKAYDSPSRINQMCEQDVLRILLDFRDNNIGAKGELGMSLDEVLESPLKRRFYGREVVEYAADSYIEKGMLERGLARIHARFYHIPKKMVGEVRSMVEAEPAPKADREQQALPVEVPNLDFVQDDDLRKILERDYREIQLCLRNECWKAAIILCGSAIECVLTGVFLSNLELWKTNKPSNAEADPTDARLADLIEAAHKARIIKSGVQQFADAVRGYRNFVHPGRERHNLASMRIDRPQANVAKNVLEMLIEDVREWRACP